MHKKVIAVQSEFDKILQGLSEEMINAIYVKISQEDLKTLFNENKENFTKIFANLLLQQQNVDAGCWDGMKSIGRKAIIDPVRNTGKALEDCTEGVGCIVAFFVFLCVVSAIPGRLTDEALKLSLDKLIGLTNEDEWKSYLKKGLGWIIPAGVQLGSMYKLLDVYGKTKAASWGWSAGSDVSWGIIKMVFEKCCINPEKVIEKLKENQLPEQKYLDPQQQQVPPSMLGQQPTIPLKKQ